MLVWAVDGVAGGWCWNCLMIFWLALRLWALVRWVFGLMLLCLWKNTVFVWYAQRFLSSPRAFFLVFLSFLATVHRSLCPAYRKGPQESQLGRHFCKLQGVLFLKRWSSCYGISLFSQLFVGWKLQDQFGEEAGLGTFGRRSEGPPMPERVGWKAWVLHCRHAFLKRLGSKCIGVPRSNTSHALWKTQDLEHPGL